MTASRLRLVLIGCIVIMVVGFGAGGWWVQQLLAEKVRDTDHTRIEAEVAQTELQQLRRLSQQIAEQKDVVERAKQIAGTNAQFGYQDQVINDITSYANRHGIQIGVIDFGAANTVSKTAEVNGAKKTSFNVSLRGPLPYESYLRFMQDLENNLTKIQVISMTLSPDKNPKNVTNPTINLEVYIKK